MREAAETGEGNGKLSQIVTPRTKTERRSWRSRVDVSIPDICARVTQFNKRVVVRSNAPKMEQQFELPFQRYQTPRAEEEEEYNLSPY